MARRSSVHFPGALYHVISRGNQRQKIYKDAADYGRFKTLLGEVVKRHSLTPYAYVCFDRTPPGWENLAASSSFSLIRFLLLEDSDILARLRAGVPWISFLLLFAFDFLYK